MNEEDRMITAVVYEKNGKRRELRGSFAFFHLPRRRDFVSIPYGDEQLRLQVAEVWHYGQDEGHNPDESVGSTELICDRVV